MSVRRWVSLVGSELGNVLIAACVHPAPPPYDSSAYDSPQPRPQPRPQTRTIPRPPFPFPSPPKSTSTGLVIDREDISASLSGFDQLDGGGRIGLGDTYAVLKRDISTAGGDLVDIVAYNKFGLDQPVNLRGPNGTVLTTMKPLKEAFEENEVNFDK